MRYLVLLLFLVGCEEGPKLVPVNNKVEMECKHAMLLGYDNRYCKLTNSSGISTCMQSPGSDYSSAITCEFYESLK